MDVENFSSLQNVEDHVVRSSKNCPSPEPKFKIWQQQIIRMRQPQNTYKLFFLANLLGAKLPQKHDRVFLLRWTESEFIISPWWVARRGYEKQGQDQ